MEKRHKIELTINVTSLAKLHFSSLKFRNVAILAPY